MVNSVLSWRYPGDILGQCAVTHGQVMTERSERLLVWQCYINNVLLGQITKRQQWQSQRNHSSSIGKWCHVIYSTGHRVRICQHKIKHVVRLAVSAGYKGESSRCSVRIRSLAQLLWCIRVLQTATVSQLSTVRGEASYFSPCYGWKLIPDSIIRKRAFQLHKTSRHNARV